MTQEDHNARLAEQADDDTAAKEAYPAGYQAIMREGEVSYQDYTNHTLAIGIVTIQEALAAEQRTLDEFRAEVQRRIEAAGATMLDDDEFTIELKPGPTTWDVGILVALKEQLGPTWLDKVFKPDHREIIHVPDKWDGTQLNAVARKFGGDVAETVARARIPGRPQVIVKKRGEP